MFRKVLFSFCLVLAMSCQEDKSKVVATNNPQESTTQRSPFIQILGIAQDAGYPQIGCTKSCCKGLWDDLETREKVCSIALVDTKEENYWIFDATPDIKDQIASCNQALDLKSHKMPSGVFLTHAHMGHYTGLMQFGREALGGDNIPVYAMPRMEKYLSENGPWSQLVSLKNIKLNPINPNDAINIANGTKVIPIEVPHRDEFSETVGYKIVGQEKSVLFIPDIDKWHKWDRDIKSEIASVDIALLDGTFNANGEIFGRDMSMIPHPFIVESMDLMKDLPTSEKSKVYFIHLNHTNPLLKKESEAYKAVISNGFNVAAEGQKIYL